MSKFATIKVASEYLSQTVAGFGNPKQPSANVRPTVFLLFCFVTPFAQTARGFTHSVDEREAHQIAQEAYLYLYPLVMMDVTRRVTTNYPPDTKPGMGPMNAFHHMREFPSAGFREVVRPNFDTLYSVAWLDLSNGPMIVSAPDTQSRYYLLPMLDMWTDVFAVPGKRTSGTAATKWAVVGPGWVGSLPEGLDRIDAPTSYVWIIGRTQTNGTDDYAAVNAIQDGFTVTPLDDSRKAAAARIESTIDMKTPPMTQVNQMTAADFFAYGAALMKLHPPHVSDWSMLARMKRIGLEPGKPFDLTQLHPAVRQAIEKSTSDGLNAIKQRLSTIAPVRNGWQMNVNTMGVYGNDYMKRAVVAMIGLGANPPEDAVYPMAVTDAEGKPFEGGKRYVIHFTRDQLPPVDAFWSLTIYDGAGYQVANPLNRFALGDRDSLKFNNDGSLDIYLQHDRPGADKESNWLPTPQSGAISPTLRLYAPKDEVIDGRWNPPPIKDAP